MLKLITDEGIFEYTDLVELIHKYDKNTLNMYVPSDEAMVFKLKGDVTYLVNEKFGDIIKELKEYYEFSIKTLPKRLLINFGYYRAME